jgi:hypothetical protein
MTDAQSRVVGGDAARFGNESMPCGAACVNDGGVTLEDTVARVVLTQELPDVLRRVQFGRRAADEGG